MEDQAETLRSLHDLLDRWDDIAGVNTTHYANPVERLRIIFDKAVKNEFQRLAALEGLPTTNKEKFKRMADKLKKSDEWANKLGRRNSELSGRLSTLDLTYLRQELGRLNRAVEAIDSAKLTAEFNENR